MSTTDLGTEPWPLVQQHPHQRYLPVLPRPPVLPQPLWPLVTQHPHPRGTCRFYPDLLTLLVPHQMYLPVLSRPPWPLVTQHPHPRGTCRFYPDLLTPLVPHQRYLPILLGLRSNPGPLGLWSHNICIPEVPAGSTPASGSIPAQSSGPNQAIDYVSASALLKSFGF